MIKLLLLSLLFIPLISKASHDSLVKVYTVKGNVYAFFGKELPVRKVTKGMFLNTGNIISTSRSSTVVLDLQANGIVILGPNSQLFIGNKSKYNRRHLRLLKGRVHFQTKKGPWKNRKPGAIISIKDNNIGYMGKRFSINYTQNDRALIVKQGIVKAFSLEKINQGPLQDHEDIEVEEELEDEIDYLALIEEQTADKRSEEMVKLTPTKPYDFKAVFRGVHISENQFINTDTVTTIEDENGNPDTNSQLNEEDFNPKDDYFDIRIEWNSQFKRGGGHFYTTGWFEYGNQDIYKEPLQFLQFRSEGRNYIEIAEFYYLYSWDNLDLTLGKKVIKTGFGNLISPVDQITPKDLYDPLDKRDLGNFLISIDKYMGGWTLSYTLIPYYLPNKAPQRFITNSDGDLVRPNRQFPISSLANFQNYFQAKTSLYGWDIFAGYYLGPYTSPVFKQKTTRRSDGSAVDCTTSDCQIKEEFPIIHRLSSGFSTNFWRFNLYSELLMQKAESNKDDSFYTYMFGTTFKVTNFITDQIDFNFEFIREKTTTKQATEDISDVINRINIGETINTYLESSKEARTHKHNLLGRILFTFTEKFKSSINFDYNLVDSSQLYIAAFVWSPYDNWKARLHYEHYQLELLSSDNNTQSTPFGDIDISQTTDLKRSFDRITLRVDYTF